MEAAENQRPFAWQPLTPYGVSVFAGATAGRLWFVQFLVATLAALLVVWFVNTDWFPTIRAAIERLPAQGSIQSSQLNWSGDSPLSLAESRFLALVVDLQHSGQMRSPAHLQVEFGKADIWVYSLFGRLEVPYPKGYVIRLNLEDLKPWWGAWAPAILAVAGLGMAAGLLVSWTALTTLYCLPAWLLALYFNRKLSLGGSWKLAGAALIPGALVLTAALGLYALGGMDVVHVLTAWVLHILLGWGYVIMGVLARPKLQASLPPKHNPFLGALAEPNQPAANPPGSESSNPNPFSPKR